MKHFISFKDSEGNWIYVRVSEITVMEVDKNTSKVTVWVGSKRYETYQKMHEIEESISNSKI